MRARPKPGCRGQSALSELPWVFSEAFPSDEARVAIRACAGSLSD